MVLMILLESPNPPNHPNFINKTYNNIWAFSSHTQLSQSHHLHQKQQNTQKHELFLISTQFSQSHHLHHQQQKHTRRSKLCHLHPTLLITPSSSTTSTKHFSQSHHLQQQCKNTSKKQNLSFVSHPILPITPSSTTSTTPTKKRSKASCLLQIGSNQNKTKQKHEENFASSRSPSFRDFRVFWVLIIKLILMQH